jgi:hypothetical protein
MRDWYLSRIRDLVGANVSDTRLQRALGTVLAEFGHSDESVAVLEGVLAETIAKTSFGRWKVP